VEAADVPEVGEPPHPGWRGVPDSPGENPKFSWLTVISGGQEGADRAGLDMARRWGIKTGGWAPKGWRTALTDAWDALKGKKWAYHDLTLKEFGLKQHAAKRYASWKGSAEGRTEANVRDSDMTVWFGYAPKEPKGGFKTTMEGTKKYGKPFIINPSAQQLADAMELHNVSILNVAGNRDKESHQYGNPQVWGKTQRVLNKTFQILEQKWDERHDKDFLEEEQRRIDNGEYDPEVPFLRSTESKEKVIEALKAIGTTREIERAALILEDGTMIPSPRAAKGDLNDVEDIVGWHYDLMVELGDRLPDYFETASGRPGFYEEAVNKVLREVGAVRVHYLEPGFGSGQYSVSFMGNITRAQQSAVYSGLRDALDMAMGYGPTFSIDVVDTHGNVIEGKRFTSPILREARQLLQGYSAPTDAAYLRANPFQHEFANLLVDLLNEYGIGIRRMTGREVKSMYESGFDPAEVGLLAGRIGRFNTFSQIPESMAPMIAIIMAQHQDPAFWAQVEKTAVWKKRVGNRIQWLNDKGFPAEGAINDSRRKLMEEYIVRRIRRELKGKRSDNVILTQANRLLHALARKPINKFEVAAEELFQKFLTRGISIEPKAGFIPVDPVSAIESYPIVDELSKGLFAPFSPWALSGSLSLAFNGKVYRSPDEQIHDLDIVLLEYMSHEQILTDLKERFPHFTFELKPGYNGNTKIWGDPGSHTIVTAKDPGTDQEMMIDIFMGAPEEDVEFHGLETNGQAWEIQTIDFRHIFKAKINFRRTKDYIDYAHYKKTDFLRGVPFEAGFKKDAAATWLKRTLPNTPYRFISDIVDKVGETAYGVFRDGVVLMAEGATLGTEFHEGFHAVFRTYLNNEQRAALYKEARALRPDLESAIQLEEFLAEEFRMWMLGRRDQYNLPEYPKGIKGFFQKIWDWIRGYREGRDGIRDLFHQIDSGAFAKATPQYDRRGFLPAFLKKYGSLTYTESEKITQYVATQVVFWAGLDPKNPAHAELAAKRHVTTQMLEEALTEQALDNGISDLAAHADELIAAGEDEVGIELKMLLAQTGIRDDIKAEVTEEIRSWGVTVKFKPDDPKPNLETEDASDEELQNEENDGPENVGAKNSSQTVKHYNMLVDRTRLAVKLALRGLHRGKYVNGKWQGPTVGRYKLPEPVPFYEAWSKLEDVLQGIMETDDEIELDVADTLLERQGRTDPVINFLYENVWANMSEEDRRQFLIAFVIEANKFQTTEVEVGKEPVFDEHNQVVGQHWTGTSTTTYGTADRQGHREVREEWTASMQLDKVWQDPQKIGLFIRGMKALTQQLGARDLGSDTANNQAYEEFRENMIKTFGSLNIAIDEEIIDQMFIARGEKEHAVYDMLNWFNEFVEEHLSENAKVDGEWPRGTFGYLLELAEGLARGDRGAQQELTTKKGKDLRVFTRPPVAGGINPFHSRSFAESLLPAVVYAKKKNISTMVIVAGNKKMWRFTRPKMIQRFWREVKQSLFRGENSSRLEELIQDKFTSRFSGWVGQMKLKSGKSSFLSRLELQFFTEMRNMAATKNRGAQVQDVDMATKMRIYFDWALEGVGGREKYKGRSRWAWLNFSDKSEQAVLQGPNPLRVWQRPSVPMSPEERKAYTGGNGIQFYGGITVGELVFDAETMKAVENMAVAEYMRMYDVNKVLDDKLTKWYELEVGMFGFSSTLVDIGDRGELNDKDRAQLKFEAAGMKAAFIERLGPQYLEKNDKELFKLLFRKETKEGYTYYVPLNEKPSKKAVEGMQKHILETVRDGVRTDLETMVRLGMMLKSEAGTEPSYYYDAHPQEDLPIPGPISRQTAEVYSGMLGALKSQYSHTNDNFIQHVATVEASVNSTLAYLQQMVIVHGDLAYYKGHEDLAKRVAAANSDGVYGMPLKSDEGPDRKKTFKVSVLKDAEYPSASFSDPSFISTIVEGLVLSGIRRDIANQRAELFHKAYKNVNAADAQAWITPERWKDIQEESGRWNPTMESAYNKMMAGEDLNVYEAKLIMSPIKGVAFDTTSGGKVGRRPVYLKYSQAVITPGMARASSALRALYNPDAEIDNAPGYMQQHGIDEVVFESGIKLGAKGIQNLKRLLDGTGEGRAYVEISKGAWKLQVETPNKGAYKRMYGSQQRANFLSGLSDDMDFVFDGREIKGSELKEHYNKLYGALSDRETQILKARWGYDERTGLIHNMEKMVADLSLKVENDGKLPGQIADLLGVTPDGKMLNDLATFPMMEKSINMVMSMVKKYTARNKMFGGSATQVSPVMSASVKGISGLTPDQRAELESQWGELSPPELLVAQSTGPRPGLSISNNQLRVIKAGGTSVSLRSNDTLPNGIYMAKDQTGAEKLVSVRRVASHSYAEMSAETLHRLAVAQGFESANAMLQSGRGEIQAWLAGNKTLYEYEMVAVAERASTFDPGQVLSRYSLDAGGAVMQPAIAKGAKKLEGDPEARYYVAERTGRDGQPDVSDEVTGLKGPPLFVFTRDRKEWWLRQGDSWVRSQQPQLATKSWLRAEKAVGNEILHDLLDAQIKELQKFEQGVVEFRAGDVLLPNYMKSFLPKELQDPVKLTAFIQQNPELFNLVAHRIPGQARYSLDAVRVKGFLPPEMGDSIIMYDELTKKNGSDFDIDKLFLILPNIQKRRKTDSNGEFVTDEDGNLVWEFFAPKYENEEDRPSFINADNEARKPSRYARERWVRYIRQYLRDAQNPKAKGLLARLNGANTAAEMWTMLHNWNLAINAGNEEFIGLEIPSLEEFANWSIERQNTEAAITNEIIAIHHAVNANVGIYAQLVTPIDVMVDEMKAFVEKVRKIKEPIKPRAYETFTVGWQLQLDELFSSGKQLVARMANHVKSHSIMEGYNISVGTQDYSQSVDVGRNYMITEVISGLLSGAVDVAKEPWLAYLGLNTYTVQGAIALMRTGVDWEVVFSMLKQPIIEDYVALRRQYDSPFIRNQRGTLDQAEATIRAKYNGQQGSVKAWKIPLNDADAILDLLKSPDLNSRDWTQKQQQILTILIDQTAIGQILESMYKTTRMDTEGPGRDAADIKALISQHNKLLAIEEAPMAEIPIKGYSKWFYNHPTIKAHWNNSILFIKELLFRNQLDIAFSPAFEQIEEHIFSLGAGLDSSNAEHLRDMTKGIYQWLYTTMIKDKSKRLEDSWFSEGPANMADRVRELQKREDMKDNHFVQGLTFEWHEESEKHFVKLLDNEKDRALWSDMIDDYNDMWKHDDPTVQKLAKELGYYSLITTGGNQRKGSFFHITIGSVNFRDHLSINEKVQAMWQEDHGAGGISHDFDTGDIAKQIILHNANNPRFVKGVFEGKGMKRFRIDRKNKFSTTGLTITTERALELDIVKTAGISEKTGRAWMVGESFLRVETRKGETEIMVLIDSRPGTGMIYVPVQQLGYYERGQRIYEYLSNEEGANFVPTPSGAYISGGARPTAANGLKSVLLSAPEPSPAAFTRFLDRVRDKVAGSSYTGIVRQVAQQTKKCD
jgi:hypothetical protein